MSIQFKSGVVLFRGDKVSFCPEDCGCPDSGGPVPPDPTLNTCTACKSTNACAALLAKGCTPTRLQLDFTEPTYQTSCLTCTVDGKSIKQTGGGIAGTKVLTQDPLRSCRWVLIDDTPTLAITGYDSAGCASTATTANRVTYLVEQGFDSYLVAAIASFESLKGAQFTVFSATVPGQIGDPGSGLASGDISFANECLDFTERGGGRLASAGTVALTLCPAVPKPCGGGGDTRPCVKVPGVSIPIDDPDFTYDETAIGSDVSLPNTTAGKWESGTVSAAGVTNLRLVIEQRDGTDLATAPQGCGFYLDVFAFNGTDDILKGSYYRAGITPDGFYRNYDNLLPGLAGSLVPVNTCVPPDSVPTTCPGVIATTLNAGPEWKEIEPLVCATDPSLTLWDGVLTADPDIACRWTAGLGDPADFLFPNGTIFDFAVITLFDTGGGVFVWDFQIGQICALPTGAQLIWHGQKTGGATPAGVYYNVLDPFLSTAPAFITVT